MKARFVVLIVVFAALTVNLPAQWDGVDENYREFATDRIRAFATALEQYDLMVLFRLLDPVHMRMNVEYYPKFSFKDPREIDFAIRNWGFYVAEGAFMKSIGEIDRVVGFTVDTSRGSWEISFQVILDDGSERILRTFMDPETLLMYGAAG